MKKLLALVLALVMSMSLVTISNAAFKDADKIDHTEAVEVMNALGVINGMPDGSFAPAGNVTRAEMAKMISIIMLGDIDADAFEGTTTDLKDINTHWAEGFIKYCYSQGVIAGNGDGTFAPNANVTAVEAAKMLLVAIGYNATVQGYVGADWTINIIRDAQLSKFFDDLSVTSGKVLTRDEAAQMIYNAVNAKTIEKSSSVDRLTGKITDIYNADGDPLLKKTFGAKTWVGSFDGNYNTGDTAKKGQIQVTGKLDTATSGSTAADFASDFDIANIGEEVKVIFKDGKAGTANQPDEKDTIYGVYLTGATSVVKATVNDIESATDYTTAGKIKVNGTEYKVAAAANTTDAVVVKNFGVSTVAAASANEAGMKAAFSALSAQKGDTVKFILNSDGKVCKAYVTETTLSYITAVNSEKVTVNGIGAIKKADNVIYADAAKNDVVTVTAMYPTGDNRVYVVEKADVVSGEVKGFKNVDTAKTEKITLDGTTYKVYNKAAMPSSLANKDDVKTVMENTFIGEKFDLYLVNGYVAAAVKTSESASNYSLVLSGNGGTKGNTFNPLKLEVLGADGVKSIITVDKDTTGDPAEGNIITYTGTADKALVKIQTTPGTATTSTTAFYNKTTKTIEGTVTAGDAVLFVKTSTSGDYKAYKVRDLKDINTAGKTCKIIVDNSKVVAAYIDLAAVPSGATSTAVYGIVTAANGTVKNDSNYYTNYTVWTNDGEKTVNVKTGTLDKGELYKFEPTADGYYDNASSFTQDFGTVVAIKDYNESEKLLTYYTGKTGTAPNATWSGETTKAVADDVKVLYVNQKDNKAGEEIGVNAFDDVKDLFNAVIVMKGTTGDDANVISTIIIETSNEVDAHIN